MRGSSVTLEESGVMRWGCSMANDVVHGGEGGDTHGVSLEGEVNAEDLKYISTIVNYIILFPPSKLIHALRKMRGVGKELE